MYYVTELLSKNYNGIETRTIRRYSGSRKSNHLRKYIEDSRRLFFAAIFVILNKTSEQTSLPSI